MTAQHMDGIYYRGLEYVISNCTESIGFHPEKYGIHARLFSTANRQGFDCVYEIRSQSLRVRNITTWNSEGIYPRLNGVSPKLPEDEYENCEYKDVKLPVDYTGVLAMAQNKSYLGYYEHIGYQPFFCWKYVIGVEINQGSVVQTFDLSDLSSLKRKEYELIKDNSKAMTFRCNNAWHFGFMEQIRDGRREIIDKYYVSRFQREQIALSNSLHGRLKLGEERTGRVSVHCPIPYVPYGCKAEVIDYHLLNEILNRFKAGRMVREDAQVISSVLCSFRSRACVYFYTLGDVEKLHKIGFLIHPKYDEALCGKEHYFYHELSERDLMKLEQLINETF
ncbi:hypothetical protein [Lancefieldella rimae]|uniref:hypothetical protein n=1 Tax=Lancefieldella rimae TaxID=1383 RepID=UPI003C6F62B3